MFLWLGAVCEPTLLALGWAIGAALPGALRPPELRGSSGMEEDRANPVYQVSFGISSLLLSTDRLQCERLISHFSPILVLLTQLPPGRTLSPQVALVTSSGGSWRKTQHVFLVVSSFRVTATKGSLLSRVPLVAGGSVLVPFVFHTFHLSPVRSFRPKPS